MGGNKSNPQPSNTEAADRNLDFSVDSLENLVPDTGWKVMTVFDYNNDSHADLVLLGIEDLSLWQGDGKGGFTDVTATLPAEAQGRRGFLSSWAADVDGDGNIDLLLTTQSQGLRLLRNLGDGHFTLVNFLPEAPAVSQFVFADIEGDGIPDVALLDKHGILRAYQNMGSGRFETLPPPDTVIRFNSFAVADIRNRGQLGLVAMESNGTIATYEFTSTAENWRKVPLFPDTASQAVLAFFDKPTRLLVADMDKNGRKDLVISSPMGTLILLQEKDRTFHPLPFLSGFQVSALADFNEDGRLDMAALSPEGRVFKLTNLSSRR